MYEWRRRFGTTAPRYYCDIIDAFLEPFDLEQKQKVAVTLGREIPEPQTYCSICNVKFAEDEAVDLVPVCRDEKACDARSSGLRVDSANSLR